MSTYRARKTSRPKPIIDQDHYEDTQDRWEAFFDSFCSVLIDSDAVSNGAEGYDQAKPRVELAARLADVALEQFEQRWPYIKGRRRL